MTDSPQESPRVAGNRWRGAIVLVVIASIAAVLSLVTLAAKTPGLVVGQALDVAQIARHVSAGEGLVTDSIRPLSLAIQPSLQKHPDLYHAPLHPLLLGLAFKILHPSDRVDAGLGLSLWMLSVLLTYWVARRWFGGEVAVVATAFYGANVTMLKGAAFGLPYPLTAILVLLVSALAVPDARSPQPAGAPEHGVDFRLAGAGLLAGLLFMTHYLFLFLVPAIGLYGVAPRRRRGRAVLLFLGGVAVVTLPWVLRNLYWARSPFFSLYWYEALAGTDAHPGDSVWRSMAAAKTGPLEFGFLHPIQMTRKILSGLVRFWQEGLSVLDPVLAVVAAAGLFGGRKEAWRIWLRVMAAGVLCVIAASCYYRSEPELLLAVTPLVAMAAAVGLTEWLEDQAQALSLRRIWSTWAAPLFHEPGRLRAALRRAGLVAAVAIVGIPLLHYLLVYRAEGRGTAWEADALARLLPEGAVVMTDQPAVVAWAGHRHAVWLGLEESVWGEIEARGGAIDATYLSPSIASNPLAATQKWWAWIASPRGVYRDLVPVDASPLPGSLRRRRPEKG